MKIFIIVLWICAIIVALRMNYEATFLTWDQGPQMIGFSFVHTYGIPFILALLCLIVVTFFWMIAIIVKLIKKIKMEREYIIGFLVSVIVIAVNFMPYSISQSGMILVKGLPKDTTRFFATAAHEGHLGLMKLMIKTGYRPDSTVFTTCLYNACFNGYIDVIEYSLEHEANINYQCDDYKITPLMVAAENNEYKTIEYLLAYGADPKLRANIEEMRTALDWAIYYKHDKCIAILSKYK